LILALLEILFLEVKEQGKKRAQLVV